MFVSMPCIFSQKDNKVVIERKVLCLKRRVKNPNDQRLEKNKEKTTVFYLPITRDLAERLGLNEGSFVKAEIAKSADPISPS